MSEKKNSDRLFDEELLRDALSPFKPDADSFNAAVREKIATEEVRRAANPQEGQNSFMRRAAVLVPPGLFAERSATGTDAAIQAGTATTKSLSYFLAWPILSIAALFGGFFSGVSAARRIQVDDSDRKPEEVKEWWRRHLPFASLGWVALFVIPFLIRDLNTYFYALAATLLGFGWYLRRLEKKGWVPKAVVGHIGYMLLLFLAIMSPAHKHMYASDAFMIIDPRWAAVIFQSGLVVCAILMIRIGKRKLSDSFRVLACLPLVLMSLSEFMAPRGASDEELVEFVNDFHKGKQNSATWPRFRVAFNWLEQNNVPGVELSSAEQYAVESLIGNDPGNPYLLSQILATSVLKPESLKKVVTYLSEDTPFTLFGGTGSFQSTEQPLGRLRLLLARRPITAKEKAHILSRVESSWVPIHQYTNLSEIYARCEIYELIHAQDELLTRRAEVHQALNALWLPESPSRFTKSGGFKAYANIDASDDTATWCAVELMQRFGVPPEIDLRKVRNYLEQESLRHWSFQPLPAYDVIPAVTLKKLENSFPIPEPTTGEILLALRPIIAAALITLLCIYVTYLAKTSNQAY